MSVDSQKIVCVVSVSILVYTKHKYLVPPILFLNGFNIHMDSHPKKALGIVHHAHVLVMQ